MGILDYFKPVSTWPADKVREFIHSRSPQDYNLIDVRTPREYKEGHLPGARLIPVGEIEARWEELESNKPTITY